MRYRVLELEKFAECIFKIFNKKSQLIATNIHNQNYSQISDDNIFLTNLLEIYDAIISTMM